MDNDRQAFEFAYALYLARQVDPEAAQLITEAALEAGEISIAQATCGLTMLAGQSAISSALQ